MEFFDKAVNLSENDTKSRLKAIGVDYLAPICITAPNGDKLEAQDMGGLYRLVDKDDKCVAYVDAYNMIKLYDIGYLISNVGVA